MKPETIFGVNAGKVWDVLKSGDPLSVDDLMKATKLKSADVFGALGWLGREGKIEIISDNTGKQYKLL
jgi:DNA-binding GntR family transcriptional regulator